MFRGMVPKYNCRPYFMRGPCRGFKRLPWRSSRDCYPGPGRSHAFWNWHGYSSPFRVFDEYFRFLMSPFGRVFAPRLFEDSSYPRFIRTVEANVKINGKEYEILVDVRHFNPEHIKIKLNKDRLIISGRHEQKADEHGHVSREFTREFTLPENVDTDTMTSGVTDEGVLYIRAKMKEGQDGGKARDIPIVRET